MGTLRASVKRFSRACTTLFALSADRSNSQCDFCGKGPLFLEWVTNDWVTLMRSCKLLPHCKIDASVMLEPTPVIASFNALFKQAHWQGGFHVARKPPPPFTLVVGLELISYVMSYFEFHTGRLDESTVQTLELICEVHRVSLTRLSATRDYIDEAQAEKPSRHRRAQHRHLAIAVKRPRWMLATYIGLKW